MGCFRTLFLLLLWWKWCWGLWLLVCERDSLKKDCFENALKHWWLSIFKKRVSAAIVGLYCFGKHSKILMLKLPVHTVHTHTETETPTVYLYFSTLWVYFLYELLNVFAPATAISFSLKFKTRSLMPAHSSHERQSKEHTRNMYAREHNNNWV